MAGVYGMPLHTFKSNEGAALGAAILGGVAANVYPTVEAACEKLCKASQVQKVENTEKYDRVYSVYKSLYPSVKDIYKSLKEL